jgi:hypothetical protein
MKTLRLLAVVLGLIGLATVHAGPTSSAFSATTGSASTFASAASFCGGGAAPTPTFMTGFEDAFITSTGTGVWDGIFTGGGGPVLDTSVKRHGNDSLQIAKTSAGSNYLRRTWRAGHLPPSSWPASPSASSPSRRPRPVCSSCPPAPATT